MLSKIGDFKLSLKKILFQRHPSNPILTAEDWPYRVHCVLNPGATVLPNGEVLLLVTCEDFRGFKHLTIARSKDGISNWEIDEKPVINAYHGYRKNSSLVEPLEADYYGCKDPRITYLQELEHWAITYVSYSKVGPEISLLLTKDFKTFEHKGCIMPPHNKDAALFPRKFKNKWLLLNRPTYGEKANVWLSYSTSQTPIKWGNHSVLFHSRKGGWWDYNSIGIGPPPIETDEGWLVLYHGVRATASGKIYRIGMVLLDKENPAKVLHRTDDWVFGPEEHYEREGNVDDRIFPCGVIHDTKTNELKLYYGAADTSVAVAIADVNSLVDHVSNFLPFW